MIKEIEDKMDKLINKSLKKLFNELMEHGNKVYLVGGSVRDLLIGRENIDFDIEVFGEDKKNFEDILEKHGKLKKCGKIHEVYLLKENIEISFILKDKTKENLKVASFRRDFNINSIYYDCERKVLIDPLNGLNDINKKIVKMTSENVFKNDPVRILRGIELANRLSFEIEKATKQQMKRDVVLLLEVPIERIIEELRKIYLKHKDAKLTFEMLLEIGVIEVLFPKIYELKNIMQDNVYHPEGDVLTHTFMMLNILQLKDRSMDIFWSILYHDSGKQLSYPTFENHSNLSIEVIENEGKKYIKNKREFKEIKKLIKYHEAPLKLHLNKLGKIEIKKLAIKVSIEKLLKLYRCDVLGRGKNNNEGELNTIKEIKKIYNEVKNELKPIVTGKHLIKWNIKEKKEYGKLLEKMYSAQINEEIKDEIEALEYYKKNIKKHEH